MHTILRIAAVSAASIATAAAGQTDATNSSHLPVSQPVDDVALDRMRGGLLLPNGLDVAIGIDIQTWVDGSLTLHTVYASDGPQAGTRVYTDGTEATKLAPGTTTVPGSSQMGMPLILTGRSPSGTVIAVGARDIQTVNILDAPPSNWLTGGGETLIPVRADGQPVTSDVGTITLTETGKGAQVLLKADDLEIRHLLGQATGVVIANTANDRIIESVSSVNIDLRDAPILASATFASEALSLDLLRGR
jgi:hypothetical protein